MTSPYELLGGEPVVRAIVDRFYDLVETDPAYADLRDMHVGDLAAVRQGLVGYLTGWAGGPRDWFAGGKCVMSLHGGLPIGSAVTQQWVDAMARAIEDQVDLDPALARSLTDALTHMALGMINRTDEKAGAAG